MKLAFKLSIVLSSMVLISCATFFDGYEDEVTIFGASDNLKIETQDNFSLEIKSDSAYYTPPKMRGKVLVKAKKISLPKNKDYILSITDGDENYKIFLNRKLGFGWFTLDAILFVIPAVYDGIAGTWFYYDDIDLNLYKKK